MGRLIFLLCLVVCCTCICDFEKSSPIKGGQPLILTPLINAGQIGRAKRLSRVQPFDGFNYNSHSGFLTIDQTYDSNAFFWFFRSRNNWLKDPVILFYNGGPGTSAMYGLFGEIGPFSLDLNMNLVKREFNWVEKFNVIFADLPIGAGYSFTRDDRGYARSDRDIALMAINFLHQFFKLFPELIRNDLYISPESYSTKSGLLAGSFIKTERSETTPINLKGVILMSGFIHPMATVESWSSQLYHCGLINKKQRTNFENITRQIRNDFDRGLFAEASQGLFILLVGASQDSWTYFTNYTGMTDASCLLATNIPRVFVDYAKFVQLDSVRQRIHVGNATFRFGNEVVKFLTRDLLSPAMDAFGFLLNQSCKIMSLNGNLDLIANPAAQEKMNENLNWIGSSGFYEAERIIWRASENDEDISGYVTQHLSYVYITLRNAGHMVPHYKPREALAALTLFINDQAFK